MAWTLDPPLGVLRAQLQAAAPRVPKSSFGTIAGASHRQEGPHYPESPPPSGNPDNEVDALDVPHAPSLGLDCAVMCEALRRSRDHRIKLVIFDSHIFSSYDHAEGPAWTWRPYRGEDDHSTHAHVERNDSYRTDLSPFKIGIDMSDLDRSPRTKPTAVGDRGPGVQLDDVWGQEASEKSPYDGAQSARTRRLVGHTEALKRLEVKADALAVAVGQLGTVEVDMTDEAIEAICQRTSDLVVAKLGALRFTPTAE